MLEDFNKNFQDNLAMDAARGCRLGVGRGCGVVIGRGGVGNDDVTDHISNRQLCV
jgi:hypothetical protein